MVVQLLALMASLLEPRVATQVPIDREVIKDVYVYKPPAKSDEAGSMTRIYEANERKYIIPSKYKGYAWMTTYEFNFGINIPLECITPKTGSSGRVRIRLLPARVGDNDPRDREEYNHLSDDEKSFLYGSQCVFAQWYTGGIRLNIQRSNGTQERGSARFQGCKEVPGSSDTLISSSMNGSLGEGWWRIVPNKLVGGLGYELFSADGKLINASRYDPVAEADVRKISLEIRGRSKECQNPLEVVWTVPCVGKEAHPWPRRWVAYPQISYNRGLSWVPIWEKGQTGMHYENGTMKGLHVEGEPFVPLDGDKCSYTHLASFYDYYNKYREYHFPIFRVIYCYNLELVIAECDFKTGVVKVTRSN